jgi:hypothetical protein
MISKIALNIFFAAAALWLMISAYRVAVWLYTDYLPGVLV